MERRGFLSLLAALPLAFLGKRAADAGGHYFQWTGDVPFTTDPRYAKNLKRGYHHRTLCDGVDVGELGIRSMFTGPNGWVEVQRKRPGDPLELSPNKSELKTWILRGHVEYIVDREPD